MELILCMALVQARPDLAMQGQRGQGQILPCGTNAARAPSRCAGLALPGSDPAMHSQPCWGMIPPHRTSAAGAWSFCGGPAQLGPNPSAWDQPSWGTIQPIFLGTLPCSHGTVVCHGILFGNHWPKKMSRKVFHAGLESSIFKFIMKVKVVLILWFKRESH